MVTGKFLIFIGFVDLDKYKNERSINTFIFACVCVCKCRIQQDKSATAPSPQPTTEEPWASCSCMTSLTRTPSMQFRTGELDIFEQFDLLIQIPGDEVF